MTNRLLAIVLTACLGCVAELPVLGADALSAEVGATESGAAKEFGVDVRPLLQSYCVRCHGPQKQEASLRLDNLSTDLLNDRAAAEHWHEVLNVLKSGEMPPEGERQPSAKQRSTLIARISQEIQRVIEIQKSTQGRGVLRRLNREQYQNTMTDLLGLQMDYVRDLPPDAISADGFRNNGQSLQMSALQLEYYLDTARRALDRVIVNHPAPKKYDFTFTESNVRGWLGKPQFSNTLQRSQEFLAKMAKDYPEAGDFLVRVKLTADLMPDVGFPLLEVSVGYRPDTKILFREFDVVEVTSGEEQTFEFRGRIEDFPLPVRGQGKYPGLVVRVRNVYDDGSPRPKSKNEKKKGTFYPDEPGLPRLHIKSVEFHGPVYDQWPPAVHRQILFASPLRQSDETAYLTEVLKRFLKRAYRRPVQDSDVELLREFYQEIRPEFPDLESAVRETLAMALIRPEFLYLLEPAEDQKRPVTSWEMASRLSYFLWSSMPDERLMKLAEKGELKDPGRLQAEVDRMLDDPRATRFYEQFTEQWLQLNVVDSVAVSRDEYPAFDDSLKRHMRQETQQFFTELIRHNLSALNLLSSDFSLLNEPLAKHYGIPGVYGRKFRRVSFPADSPRGGVLGHASVLLSNSTGVDSHPVRRAVWIRDRLLNDPPAPPPPDVPSLDEADPDFLKLSVREQLEIHRDREACSSCHQRIDPWGLALENFDAVGNWRESIRRKSGKKTETVPVDATSTLPGGIEFNGPFKLKDYLVTQKKDHFARSLAARLLEYSLGRRMELSDRDDVDQLAKKFAAVDYRLRDFLKALVTSRAFQTR